MVVGMSLYSQIREAYISGESQRSIAKRLGASRPTVKKYCEGETMLGIRKEYLRAPSVVTPAVEHFIRMFLGTMPLSALTGTNTLFRCVFSGNQ